MMQEYPIDIVLPWVDGSDPAWLAERARYSGEAVASATDDSSVRYRDAGILRYLLRSIDCNMPWVRTVHLVTWGHLPSWLNPDAEGLHIVRHEEFIPAAYLPTFSSHTIELNMHRIPGLADHFIYFNDDMLVLRPTKAGDFFCQRASGGLCGGDGAAWQILALHRGCDVERCGNHQPELP